MLRIEDLTVRFGAHAAVDGVTLEVPTGSVLAVLGPSGCGKSTLLRAVAGLETPSAGHISYDGTDLADTPVHKRGFALMFQDGQLFEQQTVARNIGYPLRLRHLDRAEIGTRVEGLLELVGLSAYADRSPSTLSGGERQRVALARALAVEPRLLLLDEPLSALDRGLREELAGQLRQILTTAGTTAILVTHDQEEAFAVADRMALMREGRLVQSGSVEQVWKHPADAWSALFLGYSDVVHGEAAAELRRVTGVEGHAVALRRSALRVDPTGLLQGRVSAARATSDLIRLDVEVAAIGVLHAVAEPGAPVAVGSDVRLALDPTRAAPLAK